jgi:predicted ATPase
MLKKLTIRNFKAIQDMTIEFNQITILIGGNSSGKSTVFQILDFLKAAITFNEIKNYFEYNEINFDDFKSKYIKNNEEPIEIISEFVFMKDGKPYRLEWSFSIQKIDDTFLIREKVENLNKEEIYCSYNNDRIKNTPEILDQVNLKSSALNFLYNLVDFPSELLSLRYFIESISNFGLISPFIIRNSKRDFPFNTLGEYGEYLYSFINKMTSEQRGKLNFYLSNFLGYKVEVEIEALQKGFFDLWVRETYSKSPISIHSNHVSEGLLKLIALISIIIYEYSNQDIYRPLWGLLLLEEIENGINPYLLEKTVGLIKQMALEKNKQVILTTHSPVLLNYIDSDSIAFLWKSIDGTVQCKKMFSTEEMKSLLEALNPGEVWINLEKEDILERLSFKKEGKE